MIPSTKKFKFNAHRVFLTYPKCTLSQDDLLIGLQALFPIKEYIIALEAHQDGTPHLHALIFFERKMHRDCERAFDIEGFHPNIQGVKNAQDVHRISAYVKKDGNFITNITEKVSKRELLAKDLLSEGLTPQFVRKNPMVMFLNYSSILSWTRYVNSADYANKQVPSVSKKIHYWIHGPSNSGKTHWLRAVLLTWNGAEIPTNNDYSTIDANTNLLWFDEYRGNLTIQQLNRLADGSCTLNTKGGSVYLRRAIVVILSNFSIEEVYKNTSDEILVTLHNRFNQYDLSINTPRFPKYIIN